MSYNKQDVMLLLTCLMYIFFAQLTPQNLLYSSKVGVNDIIPIPYPLAHEC